MVICCHNQAVDASQTQARDMKLRLLLALNFFFFSLYAVRRSGTQKGIAV